MGGRGAVPVIELIDETMREGMQIETTGIPVAAKIDLLERLSRTGLRTIVVGSFVSPRWVPQMAEIDAIVEGFRPVEGVTYLALALNRRGVERRAEHSPPLSLPLGADAHQTKVHLCDVFVRRNTNRSQADEIAAWERTVHRAQEAGATEAAIALNAAWGSNWQGAFSQDQRMDLLKRQHERWDDAGIPVVKVWLGDPMGWNNPVHVRQQLLTIQEHWPSITTYHLHLHNTRGLALVSAYAAMEALDSNHRLVIDTSVGGIGGCPYCGNGRATGMIPTEDIVEMLHGMDVETGIDLAALLDVSEQLEQVLGRRLDGHVSRAGPCPRTPEMFYELDLPLVETFEEASHYRSRLQLSAAGGSARP